MKTLVPSELVGKQSKSKQSGEHISVSAVIYHHRTRATAYRMPVEPVCHTLLRTST